jgi:hypothetical protein
MKTIPYSIVCEDIAQYFFIKKLLGLSAGIKFEMNEDCYRRYRCSTKNQVLNGYVNIANQIFRNEEFPIRLLFVIVDHDKESKSTEQYHKHLYNGLFPQVKDQVIISIPMKFIEHWLLYLKWIKANPAATKNISVENETSAKSKETVFGSKKTSDGRTESVINDLLDASHIDRLVSLSSSFNHLYTRIKAL